MLRPVDELGWVARALPAELGYLAACADQPPQGGGLADDPGVMAGIRSRRDERGQLVDAGPSADVLELASLLELVDEGDRVDRLALRVQGERGAVDPGVALTIEVPLVEDLADRGDRAGREHHRAEDRLLGVEALGGTGAAWTA